jgi:hypothetical protein
MRCRRGGCTQCGGEPLFIWCDEGRVVAVTTSHQRKMHAMFPVRSCVPFFLTVRAGPRLRLWTQPHHTVSVGLGVDP